MMGALAELDLVEVTEDLESGLVEGARGTVVALHGRSCTVEFIDADGHTIGLFEIPADKLEPVTYGGSSASVVRED